MDDYQPRPTPIRDELLGDLRAAAADRPGHAAYLEALITWHTDGRPGNEPASVDFAEVAFEPGVDLAGDVERAFYLHQGGTLAYPMARVASKRAAAKRAETLNGLRRLLP